MKNYLFPLFAIFLLGCSGNEKEAGQMDQHLHAMETAETDYSGVYHFGDSEMESDLIVNGSEGKYYAQLKTGDFNDDATDYIWSYSNLKNVRIEGNEFYSDKTNGEFVVNNGKVSLHVKESWSSITEEDGSEYGYYSYAVEDYYPGDYPEASIRALNSEELAEYQKWELRQMRNEIYARYGYIFKAEGEMDRHFRSQTWYKGQHKNVDKFLTWLEKENIERITEAEKHAKDNVVDLAFSELPDTWYGLTQAKDGQWIRFKPCLAYNKEFTFGINDGHMYVDVTSPFNTEPYDILEFKLSGDHGTQRYKGYFIVTSTVLQDTVTYNFEWNKAEKYAIFEGFYEEPVRMVCQANSAAYELVHEECDENEHY
jgi:hypothetical protein